MKETRDWSCRLLPWAAGLSLLLGVGCGDRRDPEPAAALEDRPLPKYRTDLLELAFRAATAMPVHPHLKDRSRLQGDVVDACLELGQYRRALAMIEKIDDWRRGLSYARLACRLAEEGKRKGLQCFLDLAARIAEERRSDPMEQAWRPDQIRAALARTYRLLGRTAEAEEMDRDLGPAEAARMAAARTGTGFDDRIGAAAKLVATGGFEQVQAGLAIYLDLFRESYGDSVRRDSLEKVLLEGSRRLPPTIQVDLRIGMAEAALAQEDPGKARGFARGAAGLLAGWTLSPEARIPIQARLAVLLHRTGEGEAVRQELAALVRSFQESRGQIVDIERAETLRPVAEAYHALGETRTALDYFRQVLEEGNSNPNSRPRAEDLVATCLSLAKRALEPDAALGQALEKSASGLKSPW